MREAVLIAKTQSRRGPEAFAEVTKALTDHGINIVEAHQVEKRKEILKRVKGAVKSGHKLILVAGGDGSQTTAVSALAYTDSVLGVIPAGTGNSFAQSLGMKPTIEDAIHTILNGKVQEVDLGVVNGTYFANFATIGLSAEIGLDTPKIVKKITGGLAYGLAAIGPVLTHRPFSGTVQWEKNKLKFQTFQMIVANGRYFGNTAVLPTASLTDGKLAFFTTTGTNRLDIVRMYAAFLRGTQTQLPDAHYFEAEKIVIKTGRPITLAIDGSKCGTTPAKFSVASKALKVMVPADFGTGS